MKSLTEGKINIQSLSSEPNLNTAPNGTVKLDQEINHKNPQSAIDFYKKLCLKLYISNNNAFVNILKQDSLNLILDAYTLKEMNLINKTIGKFNYFKNIILSGNDPHKNKNKTANEGKQLKNEDQKAREGDILSKLYLICQGLMKNLSLTEDIETLRIINIDLISGAAEFLSEGIVNNITIKNLIVNNCNLSNESYEILLKGILTHKAIEYLDLSSNQLNDKCGNMVSRIIARQSQRRDQIVWMYGLRNEKPSNNDYAKGLVEINLSNNLLSDISAEDIANALLYDVYLRKINLSNNQIFEEGCKKIIRVLRKNTSIVNIDLSNNPGYNDFTKKRLILKLIKNIQLLDPKVYTNEELAYINQFINFDLFYLEIPEKNKTTTQNLKKPNIDISNSNFDQTQKKKGKKDISDKDESLKTPKSFQEKRNLSKTNKKNEKVSMEKIMKELNDNFEHDVENDINISSGLKIDKSLSNDKNKLRDDCLFNHYSDSEAVLEDKEKRNFHCRCCKKAHLKIQHYQNQNKLLLKENLQMKKQKNLNEENQTGQNQTYQVENLSITNFPVNISTGVAPLQKLPPTTGEDGSYEAYYYKIEHLLLELTRLMDNVENNINNTNNQNISRPENNNQVNRLENSRKLKKYNTDPIEEEN